jgi:hypothetical protein
LKLLEGALPTPAKYCGQSCTVLGWLRAMVDGVLLLVASMEEDVVTWLFDAFALCVYL